MRLNIQLFADDEVSINFSSKVSGTNKLEKYAESLERIQSAMQGIDKGTVEAIDNSSSSIKSISKDVSSSTSSSSKLAKNLNIAFNITALASFARAIKSVATSMGNLTSQSATYLENMNLLDVAFSGDTKEADKFVNKLSEMYGLDESWGYRTVGIFKQLANAMGLASEVGDKLSTTMTQFSIDIASLYNIDTSDAVSILQSALAGQTKPARRLGADITQSTLQSFLDSSNIDKSITSLSYAEKRLVIVASLLDQVSEANNDWGRTIESTANQTRILSEQWSRFTRSLGNVFLPIIQKVLPYLNAILMVMTDIISEIAALVGYDASDFDYFSSTDDSVSDLAEDLSSAATSAEKLKSGLRGFDKLNVVSSSSSSSSASSLGISEDILDLFNKAADNYNSKLTEIRMRATEIKEAIEDWLGMSDGTYKNLKLIGAVLATIVGLKIISKIKSVATIIGGTALGKSLKNVAGYIVQIFGTIKKFGLKGFVSTELAPLLTKMKALLPVLSKVVVGVAGLAAGLIGANGVRKAMKQMTTEQDQSSASLKKYYGNVALTTAGFTALGSVFGPIGAGIGAVTGLVVSATAAIIGYNQGVTALAESNIFGELSVSQQQWQDILASGGTQIEDLSAKLETLQSDLNSSYESFNNSAESIELYSLKFKLAGDKISGEDGEAFLSSISSLAENANEIIQSNGDYTLEILGGIFENSSVLTDEEENNILQSVIDSNKLKQEDISTAQDNITTTYKNAIETRGYLTDEEYKYIKEQLAKIKSLTEEEMTKNQTDIEYFKQQSANKNLKLDEESYSKFEKALKTYYDEQMDTIAENYKIQYNAIMQNISDEEERNKQLQDLNNSRMQDEENVNSTIEEARKTVYGNLADEYTNLQSDTSDVAKKEKEIIEGIFSNIDIDSSEIISEYSSIGTEAGKTCANSLQTAFNKNSNLKMKIIPTKDQQEKFGMSKNYEIPITITKRANGGLPPVGQIFIANENGPELIGHIGGQSFVANQNQMMELLDKKLGNSTSGVNHATFIIQVGNKQIAKEVITDLQDMAKTNGKPITIGG